MSTVIPQVIYEIISLIAEFIRLLGMAAVGLGVGYLAVDLLRKVEGWPMQAVAFLGLAGVVIAMVVFLTSGALGAFGIGLGVAVFIWGMPKKKKEEQE